MNTRQWTKMGLLVTGMLTAQLACAGVISLNFELPSLPSGGGNGYEQILNYYNGGADQYGDVGPNLGVVFNSTALALGQYPVAPNSNTGNEPGGGNALIFLSANDAILNYAAGFTTGFSFYYDAPAGYTGTINVYSGVNDTGTLLASLSLPGNGISPTEPWFSMWTALGVTFAGTAESIDFGGTANEIAFADVTFGSGTPAATPDSTDASLYVISGLFLAGAAWRFRKQTAAA